MKHFAIIAAMAAIVMGCETWTGEDTNDNGLYLEWTGEKTSKNGLYLDGRCIVRLRSAFNGGAMASEGTSNRCRIYEKDLETGPRWDEVPEVIRLQGFMYRDDEYSSLGQSLLGITVLFPDDSSGLGETLMIPMTQGEYDGRCDKVSAVKVIDYSFLSSGGISVEIDIKLVDGRSLRIHYSGKVSSDGYV